MNEQDLLRYEIMGLLGALCIKINYTAEHLDNVDLITIADFYDVVGITRDARDYQDCKYGWYDLGPASIKGVPGGYTIVFPKPVPLN